MPISEVEPDQLCDVCSIDCPRAPPCRKEHGQIARKNYPITLHPTYNSTMRSHTEQQDTDKVAFDIKAILCRDDARR